MDRALSFEQAVHATIAAHGAIIGGDRVLVAVSGGADSTALLAALDALRRRGTLAIELAVAHLNHGLRGAQSDRDQRAVEDLAARLGLRCFIGRDDAQVAVSGNREERARDARYAFLRATAERWGATRIAVAHTRDDQAETVLLRLARGAGPASLGAMEVVRPDGVVRPLLEQPRAACVAYLEARGLTWVEDGSNADESFFRNRVRRRLLPLLDAELGVDVRQRLARLASELRQESALAERQLDLLLADSDDALALRSLADAGVAAPRLLHTWLARRGVRASERQVEGLLGLVRGGKPSATLDLGGGWQVRRVYERLVVERAPAPVAVVPDAALAVPGVASIPGWQVSSVLADAASDTGDATSASDATLLDAACLDAPLTLRPPRAADRVRLVYGRRKLADILIDAKVPRQERKRLAVISSGSEVVWVPGVVRSVIARPSPSTHVVTILHAARVGIE